jgi:hypothetical protein
MQTTLSNSGSGGDLCLGLGDRTVVNDQPCSIRRDGFREGSPLPQREFWGIIPKIFRTYRYKILKFGALWHQKLITANAPVVLKRKRICCRAAALVLLSNWSQKLGGLKTHLSPHRNYWMIIPCIPPEVSPRNSGQYRILYS